MTDPNVTQELVSSIDSGAMYSQKAKDMSYIFHFSYNKFYTEMLSMPFSKTIRTYTHFLCARNYYKLLENTSLSPKLVNH